MDASDLINALQTILQGGARTHMGNVGFNIDFPLGGYNAPSSSKR